MITTVTLSNSELRHRAAVELLERKFQGVFDLCLGEQRMRCQVMELIPACGTYINLWFVPVQECQLGEKVYMPGHWYFVELSINAILSAEYPLTDGLLTVR